MQQTKITLSKTIKVPIAGISFSNKVVEATIEYDVKEFNAIKAVEEINQLLTMLKNEDPQWVGEAGKNASTK